MDRLQWSDVDLDRLWLVVRKGEERRRDRPPTADSGAAKPILLRAFMLQSRPERGPPTRWRVGYLGAARAARP